MTKSVTVKFGLESLTKQFDGLATVGDVIDDASVKAGLGYGDNVRALSNGVELPEYACLADGAMLVVETRCNQKAMAANEIAVTIRFGLESITKIYTVPVFVSTIKTDASVKAALGFGDNVRVLQNGVELPDGATLSNGSTVVVETRCNTKAS